MSNEIKIIVGGDPSGFMKAAREVNASTERMRKGLSDAAGAVKPLNNAIGTAGDALKTKVVTGANQATNALMNFGRIAQDAPYGFIGWANNINPALESVQRLIAETGSLKGALKSLATGLTGAAGLGLAVSITTSIMTAFSMSSHGAKENLEGFAKAIDEANKKAGEELARVQVLNAVITDNTRTQADRISAAKELSDILKEQNINMSKEAILNGQVAEATKLATAAVIERAKARAIEARIGELSGQQLQRDLKRIEVTEKLTKAQKELASQEKINQQVIGGGSVPGIRGNTGAAALAVSNLKNEVAALDKATAETNKEIAFLINQIKKDDLKLDIKGGKDEKAVDLLKQRIAALKEIQSLQGLDVKQQVELVQLEIKLINRDGPKLGFSPAEIKQQSDALLEQAFPVKTFEFDTVVTTRVNKLEVSTVKDPKALTEDFKTDIAKAIGIDGPIEVPMPPVTITKVAPEVQKALDQFKAIATEAVTGAASLLGETFAQLFNGESAGAALASAAQGLMNILGSMLQEVGKNMIAASAAVQVLTSALSGLFGIGGAIAGLAAGALLISVGALVKNIEIPKFAEGGIVNKATLGIFGERGPEVIMPLNKLPGLFQAMIEGGYNTSPSVNLNGRLSVTGKELSLLLENTNQSRRRLG